MGCGTDMNPGFQTSLAPLLQVRTDTEIPTLRIIIVLPLVCRVILRHYQLQIN